MSPLDTELRHTLSQHSTDVDVGSDFWAGVEHRARVIHRRRVGASGVLGTAVIAAVVVVGVNVSGAGQSARIIPLHPSPSGSQRTAPSAMPSLPGGRVPVTGWQAIGADPTWVRWDAVLRSMPAQMPSGFAPLGTPHVIGSGDTDGGAVTVFVVTAGDHLVAGAVLRSDSGKAVAVHDLPSEGDVPCVGVVVHVKAPGGGVDDGVVVGAPTTGQIEFKLPGEPDFHAVEGSADPRWATVTLGQVQPGQPVAQVRVLDGNGNVDQPTYTGPISAGLTFPDV